MKVESQPPVSVITPLYNCAEHLAECIESVLAQTYSNWDYTIVNNVSTDESLAIARKYAARDPRIRVVNNDSFLNVNENHNKAINQISPRSKYCKFVLADDWLYPNCIEEMVQLAEAHPSLGIVSAYAMNGCTVRRHGPLYPAHQIPGREMCRSRLLGGHHLFGTMTSILIRADLLRKRRNAFNEENLQADVELCFDLLQESDFGFVHQVLCFSRDREESTESFASSLNSHSLSYFLLLLKYGPSLLDKAEYKQRWKIIRRDYHRALAHNVLRMRPRQFWEYHERTLAAYGDRIDPWLLMMSVTAEIASQLSHPLNAFKGVWRWWHSDVRRLDAKRMDEYQKSIGRRQPMPGDSVLNLKAGEWIEVRPKEEILQTLDEQGRLGGLPFMPEMLEYCGRRFRVYKRADKTCDPAHSPWSIRRVETSVHLEGVRCNGEGHSGCQAGCLIFWKEHWLKRVADGVVLAESLQTPRAFLSPNESNALYSAERIMAASQSKNAEGQIVYSCQATELRSFTSDMAWWDPRQYIRDLRSGNLKSSLAGNSRSEQALEFMLGFIQVLRAFILSFFREYRRLDYPCVAGAQERSRIETLDLQPGELVQVRTKEEILATLDKGKRNRGLWFDGEMLPYCGGIYRVLRRVHRILDEKTGKMVVMKYPCIVLEGVVCKSDFNRLCPRAIYPYWRESWLKRAVNTRDSVFAGQVAETCERS